MKILIINLHSSRNAGDAALAALAIQQLRENFPGCAITLSMTEPESHLGLETTISSFGTWFKDARTQRFRGWAIPGLLIGCLLVAGLYRATGRVILFFLPPARQALLRAYLEADLVVSCPGGFLYDSKSGLGLVSSLYTLLYACWSGKPLYLLPQSFGPLKHIWQHWLMRFVLNQARLVMARELLSLQLLKTIGVRQEICYFVPDLAFALEQKPRGWGHDWLSNRGFDPAIGGPLLGITVIDWAAQNASFEGQTRYEVAIAAVTRHFVTQWDGRVIYFPQVWDTIAGHDDRVPARRIVAQLSDIAERLLLVEETLPFEHLKACYGWMQMFIGTRLHSNIFALTEGVLVLAIGYQSKTAGVMQAAGLGEWVLDINEITPEVLLEKLVALWGKRENVQAALAQTLPVLAQQAHQAGRFVLDDYSKYRRQKG